MKRSAFAAVFLTCTFTAQGSETPLTDSLTDSLSDDMVHVAQIATQANQNIDYQPFILSVWEHNDLVSFGARNLKDALLLIPGTEIMGDSINNRTPIIRGSNPFAYGQTKLVIDGIVVNDQAFDSYNAYLDLPIELIKRLEIVRGSGSFIEGVNGYSGTINIITFAHDPAKKSGNGSLFVAAGNNNERQAGMWQSLTLGSGKLSIDAFTLKNDAISPESVTDKYGKTGYAPLGMKQTNAGISYRSDAFYLIGKVNDYTHASAFGNLYALPDPEGKQKTPSWQIEAGYHHLVSSNTVLKMKAGISEDSWDSDARSLPENTPIRVAPGVTYTYPNGYWAFLKLQSRRTYATVSATYTGLKNHTITAGYTNKHEKIIDISSVTTQRIDGGTALVDYTATAPFLNADAAYRQSHEYYLNDTIDLSPSTALALNIGGVNASDSGSSNYARAALVYQPDRRNIFKFMAGNSYRLPSWQEMYTMNNPARIGNSELKPERVRSYEAQYIYKPSVSTTAGINLFHLRNKDQISVNRNYTFQNIGARNITGFESEIRGSYGDKSRYSLSYAYLSGESIKDSENIDFLTHSSSQLIKGAFSYALTPELKASIVGRYENEKKRSPDDSRLKAIPSYSSIDMIMGWEGPNGVYVQGLIKNIADNIYRYSAIPYTYKDDLPVEGRTVYLRAGWKF